MSFRRMSGQRLALLWAVALALVVADFAALRAYGEHVIAEGTHRERAAVRAQGSTRADTAFGPKGVLVDTLLVTVLTIQQAETERLADPTRHLQLAENVASGTALAIVSVLVGYTGWWIWDRTRTGRDRAPAV